MMLVANWRLQILRFEGNPSSPKALKSQVQDAQKEKKIKKISAAPRKVKLKRLLTRRLKENVREYVHTIATLYPGALNFVLATLTNKKPH